jgi:hypothetical protein
MVRLEDARCSTVDAEQTRAFVSTLRILEDHKRVRGELHQSAPRGSTLLAVFASDGLAGVSAGSEPPVHGERGKFCAGKTAAEEAVGFQQSKK